MYSRTCYEQPPLQHRKSGLLTQVAAHMQNAISQQTRGIHPMLFQCWSSGPTMRQHWMSAQFLLPLGYDRMASHRRLAAQTGSTVLHSHILTLTVRGSTLVVRI